MAGTSTISTDALLVIGAGPGGLVAAAGAVGIGGSATLVERGAMGGDCLNVGCVPSKALLHGARAGLSFSAAQARLRQIQNQIRHHDSVDRFQRLGVNVLLGTAQFLDGETVSIDGTPRRFRRCIIATGTRPKRIDLPGFAPDQIHTNETIFDLPALPPRLAIVGGGPIAVELGQAFARFGSQVIFFLKDRLLPQDDPAVGPLLQAHFQSQGVQFRTGLPTPADADAVLVAIGRWPNTETLNLAAAGIVTGDAGILIDSTLRTSNPRVLAIGDVAQRVASRPVRFTHAADAMARLALRN
ncbi:MAG: FAD-dependent oxidoreductase, partial [Gemmataceae bacterium]